MTKNWLRDTKVTFVPPNKDHKQGFIRIDFIHGNMANCGSGEFDETGVKTWYVDHMENEDSELKGGEPISMDIDVQTFIVHLFEKYWQEENDYEG